MSIPLSRDNFWEQFIRSFSKIDVSVFSKNVLCIYKHIVNPHDSMILCVQIGLLAKLYVSTHRTFWAIHRHVQSSEKCEPPRVRAPAEVELGDALPSCLSSHIVNKCPFLGLFNAMFSHFSAFGGLAVENGPNRRGEVPPSAPESKKAEHVPQIDFVHA